MRTVALSVTIVIAMVSSMAEYGTFKSRDGGRCVKVSLFGLRLDTSPQGLRASIRKAF